MYNIYIYGSWPLIGPTPPQAVTNFPFHSLPLHIPSKGARMSFLKFVTAAGFLRRKFVTAAGFRRTKFVTAAGFTENITKYNTHAIPCKHRIGQGSPKLSPLTTHNLQPEPHSYIFYWICWNQPLAKDNLHRPSPEVCYRRSL